MEPTEVLVRSETPIAPSDSMRSTSAVLASDHGGALDVRVTLNLHRRLRRCPLRIHDFLLCCAVFGLSPLAKASVAIGNNKLWLDDQVSAPGGDSHSFLMDFEHGGSDAFTSLPDSWGGVGSALTSATLNVAAQQPSLFDVSGYFYGMTTASMSSLDDRMYFSASHQLYYTDFVLDQPGTLSASVTSISSLQLGFGSYFTGITVDGLDYAGDVTLNLSPGSHWLSAFEGAESWASSDPGYQVPSIHGGEASYHVVVTSSAVPEPVTLIASGVAILGLLCRRKGC